VRGRLFISSHIFCVAVAVKDVAVLGAGRYQAGVVFGAALDRPSAFFTVSAHEPSGEST
jgi:hypothetical protein